MKPVSRKPWQAREACREGRGAPEPSGFFTPDEALEFLGPMGGNRICYPLEAITKTLTFPTPLPSLSFLPRTATDGCDGSQERKPIPADSPEAGYVYLSASPAMPGFVQIATSRHDPHLLKWSLQTLSGVTRFQSVCSVWSGDCRGLAAQFQRVLSPDQVPHHPGVFKIPIRFARQILESEAKSFPAAAKPSSSRKGKVCVLLIAAAAMLAGYLFVLPKPHQAETKAPPVYRHSLPQLRM